MPNTFGDMAVQNLWHMPYQTFMLKNKNKNKKNTIDLIRKLRK